MRGALVILLAMVVIGLILFITDVIFYRRKGKTLTGKDISESPAHQENQTDTEAGQEIPDHGELCCGRHLVCEKTGLLPLSTDIVYYDDEELDRFNGRLPESYTPEEEEEFREILMTLLPHDVAGWSRSITMRQINLPLNVREELLMIVNDLRESIE